MSDSNLRHLLTLARRGKANGGGSTGEKQARRLVICILSNAIGLDGSATDAIVDLVDLVQRSPEEGRAAVRRAIQ